MRPLVFLAFANQQDAYLATLKEESKSVYSALQALHDTQAIEIYREESAELNDVLNTFNRYKDRISIFHYAGHAGGGALELEKGNANAEGLAQLLSQLPNLKLVFLNGCSTAPQVDYLLSLGVKAVIATSVPIDDTKAAEFSGHFYRALSNKNTIRDAFNFAVNAIKTTYNTDIASLITYRGFQPEQMDKSQPLPWGLYLKADAAADWLDWALPTQSETKVAPVAAGSFEPNKDLVTVLPAIAELLPEVDKVAYDSDGKFILESREALALLIEKYPWPVAIQIRLLSSNDPEMITPGTTRLKQIISTYVNLSTLLYYISLSEIWNLSKAGTKVKPSYDIREIFKTDRNGFMSFDFIGRLSENIAAMKAAGIPFFAIEFEEFYNDLKTAGSDTANAYLYLEGLRKKLVAGSAMSDSEMLAACLDGEYHLSSILIMTAFLVKYEFLVVRDISVNTPRHKAPTFNHYMGKLNINAANNLAISRKPKAFPSYMASSSIILSKDISRPDQYLNLAPFLIDKNAYSNNTNSGDTGLVPYLFMYVFQQNGQYVYMSTAHSFWRALDTPADLISTGEEDITKANTRERMLDRNRSLDKVMNEVNKPYAILKEELDAFVAELTS